jgi:hypothetical protein
MNSELIIEMTITNFDAKFSQIEMNLEGEVQWVELQDHFFSINLKQLRSVLDCIRGFDQGSLSDNSMLINWRTTLNSSGKFRIIEILRKTR